MPGRFAQGPWFSWPSRASGEVAAARRQHVLRFPPPALRRQDAPRQAVPRDELRRARARLPPAARRTVLRAPHATASASAVPERSRGALRTPLRLAGACHHDALRFVTRTGAARASAGDDHRLRRAPPKATRGASLGKMMARARGHRRGRVIWHSLTCRITDVTQLKFCVSRLKEPDF